MGKRHIVLDIETVLDPAVPWQGDPDRFPPAPHWEVVCIGAMVFDDYRPVSLTAADGTEREQVERFARALRSRPTLVTWNGRGFDLPVLAARAFRNAVPMPDYYAGRPHDYRYRFTFDAHLDLADVLCDHGAGGRGSLDAFAKLAGLPGKTGMDGSMVGEAWAAGRRDEVRRYCCQDVAQTAFCWLRFELLRGTLTPEEYEDADSALESFCANDERVSELLATREAA